MAETAINILDLNVDIGPARILSNVSLRVDGGEHVAIIGPNGAGKTTLLKSVMRVQPASSGTIEVCGTRLSEYSQRELAKVVSYVPQSDGRLLPFTALEFVKMGRYPHMSPLSPPTAGDLAAVERAMEQTKTAQYADRRLDTHGGCL